MTLYALKFVREDKIDEHLALGWMGARPNAPHHHLTYGIEMKWVCPCAVPGGFGIGRSSSTAPEPAVTMFGLASGNSSRRSEATP